MSSTKPPVRVRFAPSPTGLLHVGGLRSALFNWLWARHNDGVYVLRIEDTDRSRLVEGAIDQILEAHRELGITPDEGPDVGGKFGPYLQSQRLDIYHEHAAKLLKTGALYRCWCSSERLTKLREEAQKKGIAFKYDRHCLTPENHKSESPHVLRFRIPDEPKTVAWDDAVRGRLEFKTTDLDDFVAVKADGYPTYQFANVVDDHLMQISHVLRADEWIASTPKHILLYNAFEWEHPIFAHLPAVQGATGGKKLSKRDGAKSVQEFIADGYLPEALRSFLASLGWNDGTTQEIYSTRDLIERFTLDRIQKSPARFDPERLTWINGKMIRDLPLPELLKDCEKFWPPAAASFPNEFYMRNVLQLVKDRLKYLSELPELTDFFFTDPTPEQVLASLPLNRVTPEQTKDWLKISADMISENITEKSFEADNLEHFLRDDVAGGRLQLGKQAGPLFMCLRAALTGKTATPSLFGTMAVLGKPIVIRRLTSADNALTN